jgi:hypothetical protein
MTSLNPQVGSEAIIVITIDEVNTLGRISPQSRLKIGETDFVPRIGQAIVDVEQREQNKSALSILGMRQAQFRNIDDMASEKNHIQIEWPGTFGAFPCAVTTVIPFDFLKK